ncbi:MAG: glycosyltransferase family 2 protein [Treponema sp.]|uniref:glycosyltransferase family 2 protein n=1 Tax=Treponema sp. TaxID=166 RepID=UPI00257A8FDA|nr:glycosyltransferase family A protein [Treponema sp.]MBQ9102616.1 glycosyltransferase family 2 protein [Treponema sp.]
MTYYPIIIPTLNRYEKLKACIDSLAQCEEAKYTELVIGLDYPPADKYIDGWKKISEYIETIKGFAKITCIRQSENIGAIKNSQLLEHYALEKYDAYIYSEDDNVFSPYFLRFINEGLDKYKEDNSVMAVCGYSYPIDWKTEKDCVLQHQYFSAWGCGCWKTKEKLFMNEINDNYFLRNFCRKGIKTLLNESPSNFIGFMNYAFYNEIPNYDISRSFYILLNNLNVLMPRKTLVTNDGWDGSGENCIEKSYIDFSNLDRNETESVNVSDVEIIFSKELEAAIFTLKPKSALIKANAKYFLIKLFGLNNIRRIRHFLRRRK